MMTLASEERSNGAAPVEAEGKAEEELVAGVALPAVPGSPRRAEGRATGAGAPRGDGPSLETGVVRGPGEGAEIVVELGSGRAPARRAKSCLVAPDEGDRVLCALDGDRVFVLAVLEGSASAATNVVAEGDLRVRATGTLGLSSGEHVEISSPREIGILAGKLQVRARAAVAAIQETGLVGRSLDARLQKVVVAAERVETRADRIVQRAKQAFRFVEALEQVRAGVFDLRAENLAAIRGESTIVAARTLAKLDGEQVKIG